MRSRVRVLCLAPVVGAILALVAVSAPAAQASFGVEKFSAANCAEGHEGCAGEAKSFGPFEYWFPKETTVAEEKIQGYTQAAGHPAWGITDFKVNTVGEFPNEAPTGIVKHVRTDVGPGVSTNPEAMAQCSLEEFGEKEAIPGTGFYPKPACAEAGPKNTVIGVNYVTVYAGPGGVSKAPHPEISDLPLKGTAYNVEPPQGRASDFGVALELPKELTGGKLKEGFEAAEKAGAKPGEGGFPSLEEQEYLEEQQYYAHTMIEGNVEWAGNYHDYYEINVSTALPLISSRLVLKGDIGNTEKGGYITLPSNCAGAGPATTNTVTLESAEGATGARQYVTPIGTEGCNGASPFSKVPFAPEFKLSPETTLSDQPDGITTELTVPHDPSPTGIDTSQLNTATVTLPEGMTLNPSAAAEVKEACTPAKAMIHSSTFGMECPEASKIGTVTPRSPDAAGGIADGQPLSRRPRRRGSDHGAAVHDVPQRRIEAVRRRCAPAGLGHAQRNDGQADGDVREQPRTAVQQCDPQIQWRRTRADRQPARTVRQRQDGHEPFTPYTGTAGRDAVSEFARQRQRPDALPRRCRSRSARAPSTSLRATRARKPRSRSTSGATKASSTCRRSRRCCRRVSSGCCRP